MVYASSTSRTDQDAAGGWSLFPGVGNRWNRWLAASREYSFADSWRVRGEIEQVAGVLLDTAALSDWWPQLLLVELVAGSPLGARRRFATRMHGFMPYTLRVDFHVVRVEYPQEFAVELTGDLVGCGGGRLSQEGSDVRIDLSSSLSLGRPLLRILSFAARPLLIAQHQWVMKQGERGLARELDRRRRVESPVLWTC